MSEDPTSKYALPDSVTLVEIPDDLHGAIVEDLEDLGVNDPDLVVEVVAGAVARMIADGQLVATRTQAAPNRPVVYSLEAPAVDRG